MGNRLKVFTKTLDYNIKQAGIKMKSFKTDAKITRAEFIETATGVHLIKKGSLYTYSEALEQAHREAKFLEETGFALWADVKYKPLVISEDGDIVDEVEN